MIAPKTFKYKCSQYGYSKVIKPKSDAMSLMDILNICPKCNNKMEKVNLNIFDKLFSF